MNQGICNFEQETELSAPPGRQAFALEMEFAQSRTLPLTHLFLASSTIQGRGVFTGERIPAGVSVLQCSGILIRGDEYTSEMSAMQVGPDQYLIADSEDPGLDDYLNHCCEPNLGFLDGSLVLYSLREIPAGEELTFHYSTCMDEQGWEIRCGCRVPSCRGLVESHSELPEYERHRLREIVLAYLRPERAG